MPIENIEMITFLKEIRTSLRNDPDHRKNASQREYHPVFANECVFLVDFAQGVLVYHNGVEAMLGYSKEEITIDFVFNGYHPQEADAITRVIRAAITYTVDSPSSYPENLLYMSYRRKKKDGSYINVLSQSSLYKDKDNSLKSLIRLTDITFTSGKNGVSYLFNANDLDSEEFKEQIHSAYIGFFTKREMQVILEMKKDLTSRQIAKELNISEYTVASHRKNIFRKSLCHNPDELMSFCRMNGIF